MNYPKYAEVNGKRYEIKTDFRIAIKCNEIATDSEIGDYERALGIICTLFGEETLDDSDNYEELLRIAKTYLSCGKEIEKEVKIDMDYIQDYDLISASFMSDFHIDLEKEKMHWYKFNNLINGLSNNEMGNCCVLNTVRNLRNYDVSKIKDAKERQKIIEAQQQFALNKNKKTFSREEQSAIDKFNKIAGI